MREHMIPLIVDKEDKGMQNKAWLQTSNSFKAQIIGKLLGDGGITKKIEEVLDFV